MKSAKVKGRRLTWLHGLRSCCLGIGVCSFFFFVSCGPDGESPNPSNFRNSISSSKPVGSTTLSHGGPVPISSRKGLGSEDSRIGQRAMVRSPVRDQERTPLPLLAAPPGMSVSESPVGDRREPTVLSGTLVTVVAVAPNRSYSMTSQSTVPLGIHDLFFEVELNDGVRGWLPGGYLDFQETTKRE